jgi:hypothetical protein
MSTTDRDEHFFAAGRGIFELGAVVAVSDEVQLCSRRYR